MAGSSIPLVDLRSDWLIRPVNVGWPFTITKESKRVWSKKSFALVPGTNSYQSEMFKKDFKSYFATREWKRNVYIVWHRTKWKWYVPIYIALFYGRYISILLTDTVQSNALLRSNEIRICFAFTLFMFKNIWYSKEQEMNNFIFFMLVFSNA